MKKTFIIILVLNFFVFLGFSQNGKIKFNKKIHDFGSIKEIDGKARCKFIFTNEGSGELKITRVRPSCGCTASNWTKTPISPGGSGFVTAVYNPKNRPGTFYKAVTVMTNSKEVPNVALFIKGKVVPRTKTKADYYPTVIGNLRFKSNHLAFMDIYVGKTKTDSLGVYNQSKQTINIGFHNIPKFLTLKANPENLLPDQEGYIVVTYYAAKRKDYGLIFDRFALKTNDSSQPLKTLNVSAKIKEDFSLLCDKDLKKAPKIVFDTTVFNFGTVKSGSKIEYKFKFSNRGKRNLAIRKVKASCGCTAIKPESTLIKKKKSSSIGIIFNTKGRKGKQHKTVTIISNDPKTPEIVLHIMGTLE